MSQLRAIGLIVKTTVKVGIVSVVVGCVCGGGVWLIQHGWEHSAGPVVAGAFIGLGSLVSMVGAVAAVATLGAFFKVLGDDFNKLQKQEEGDDAERS